MSKNLYRACWAQEHAPVDLTFHWMPDYSNVAVCGERIERVSPRIGLRMTDRHCQSCHEMLEKERSHGA